MTRWRSLLVLAASLWIAPVSASELRFGLQADPTTLDPRDLKLLMVLGRRFRALASEEKYNLVQLMTMSAADFLDQWFETDVLKATMSASGIIGTFLGIRSPGTAYVLLHHYMGEIDGAFRAWGFSRGGTGAISAAIAGAAREAGAEIRVKAAVAKILSHQGRAAGVILENGDEITAPIIASNLDPHVTFLRLIAEGELDPEFRESIRRFRTEGTSLKMNLALDGLPDFRALPGAGPQHRATMHICPSIDYVERAWDDAKYGRPSDRPLLEMTIPTMYDPSLAPPGHHIMGIFLQYAPYTLRDANWDDVREPYADHVLDLIGEYATNFRSRVLARQVLSPLDLERRFGITGGNIFHGEMSLDQMFVMRPVAGWARYRTPINGLFLCGSGAHPGGGVMGAPGYNAARAILKSSMEPPEERRATSVWSAPK